MTSVIDCYTRLIVPSASSRVRLPEIVRQPIESKLTPWVHALHQLEPLSRHLLPSEKLRGDWIVRFAQTATFPLLFLKNDLSHLLEDMRIHQVSTALLSAHPPYFTNSTLLGLIGTHENLIPMLDLPQRLSEHEGSVLRQIFKLRPHVALKTTTLQKDHFGLAEEFDLPLFLRLPTSPETLSVASDRLETFGKVRTIFTHYSAASQLLDLLEHHPQTYVTTSRQPTEVIGEAVRRLGPDRILYASDWPVLGQNMKIAQDRIHEAQTSGLITPEEAQNVLCRNAARLFKIVEPSS